MGSEGSRLAESERGVWFWLKRYSICTPHVNKKVRAQSFLGAENRICPQILEPRTWTTLPQAFKNNGYTVLGAGKYFHDGDGGLGYFHDGKEVFPGGTGAPPQQDPTWAPSPPSPSRISEFW